MCRLAQSQGAFFRSHELIYSSLCLLWPPVLHHLLRMVYPVYGVHCRRVGRQDGYRGIPRWTDAGFGDHVSPSRCSREGRILKHLDSGGFFTVFTFTMTLSHIAMASTALTTIESFTIRDQRDRESHLLAQKYGFFKWRTKTQTLKRWNHEYGDLKTEGNRWYVGGPMREWRLLMGDDPVGWICKSSIRPEERYSDWIFSRAVPIGHAKADGLAFEQNPRFGAHGERRKREAWPEHLR